MPRVEKPIFFDQTRRRWRAVQVVVAVLLISLLAGAAAMAPTILDSNTVSSAAAARQPNPIFSLTGNSADQIADTANLTNVPVIGGGPFVRVLKVVASNSQSVGQDPFTGQAMRTLNKPDLQKIGSRTYFIERYGSVGQKRIALTFDDGPNPQYTPQLLNILSKESVPSTFFVLGSNVIKYPDIAKRIVREGHVLGNHTFSHVDLQTASYFRATQEINQSERSIRAVTKFSTSYFRPPYIDSTDQGLRNSLKPILRAQQLGYTITGYDYDTQDWKFASAQTPNLDQLDPAKDHIILLHDSGGNRSYTLEYVKQLIAKAKAAGWQFVTVQQLQPNTNQFTAIQPSVADTATLTAGNALLIWPRVLVMYLFAATTILLVLTMGMNIVLATLNHRRERRRKWRRGFKPFVAVVIAGYNEESVIAKTLRSMLRSSYKNLEVVFVNDGSSDNTLAIANKIAKRSKRLTVLSQRNAGKAAALNRGIRYTKAKFVVCADADTIFAPRSIQKLIRHFANPKVGAVAGTVLAGNPVNALVRWQSLEYLTGIHVERNAQAFLNAIMIVPGACSAWRKAAVLKASGYSRSTLAEDCDLTLSIRRSGYLIAQDNEAVAYTECPLTLADLAKQRFRWVFGNTQSFWKHKRMFFNKRYGWLGMWVLPSALIGIILPILFWPLLIALTIENIVSGNYMILLIFLAATICVHFIMAISGLILAKAPLRLLAVVPMTRFVYGPLRTYLLYQTLITALKGAYVGWNKFARSGTANNLERTKTVKSQANTL